MTTAVAAVIPPSSVPARVTGASSTASRRALPVLQLISDRASAVVYGLAAVDSTGRVADRAITEALGWTPGTRLHIRVSGELIVLDADPQGVFAMSGQGHVRLPACVRHRCRVAIGDRVLLVADPGRARLVVHPVAALDAMIAKEHGDVLGGVR